MGYCKPPQAKKIKSDARKAEIVRLLADKPMALAGIRSAIMAFEPGLSCVVLRSTLYNMCCDGILAKNTRARNAKNPVYRLASLPQPEEEHSLNLRGFAPPRRINADSAVMKAIMLATPLRKLPPNTPSGCSLEYS